MQTFASMILLALLAVQCSGEATEVDVADALEADDQCSQGGDASQCTLNALQAKAKATFESQDAAAIQAMRDVFTEDERDALLLESLRALSDKNSSTSVDACTTGMVGMLIQKVDGAAACVAPCHSSCPALNAAIVAYMTKGGQPAAKRSMCSSKYSLSCLVTPRHVGPCLPLAKKADGFGMHLPRSVREFNSMCR